MPEIDVAMNEISTSTAAATAANTSSESNPVAAKTGATSAAFDLPSDVPPGAISQTHPNKDNWPVWLATAIAELEKCQLSQWKLLLWEWLDVEEGLGFPNGKVILLFLTESDSY